MKWILTITAASLMTTATAIAQNGNAKQSTLQNPNFSIAQKGYSTNDDGNFDWNKAMDNSKVDKPATYRSGNEQMLSDIAGNLVYPASAQKENLQGNVLVQFAIDAKGKVVAVKILKSLSGDCDKAAANTVWKLKKFNPAQNEGKAVPVKITIPIRFRIK